jgi:hypothetical protein
MPGGKYYRTQAQLFAHLAVVTSDPRIAERYIQMALEQLAKAEEVEPNAGQGESGAMQAGDHDRGEIDGD